MRKLILTLAPLALALAGCQKSPAAEKVKEVSVEQAAQLFTSKAATFCDANGEDTRAEFGAIPGAVMLSKYSEYEAAELPADKNASLVFYCSSTMCSAAPKAAEKAVMAGYTNVSTMPEGIKGWVKAGQPVAKPQG